MNQSAANKSDRAAQAVNQDRLWQRHGDMARYGGTPKGGVNRQALSAEDIAARRQLCDWAKVRNFPVFSDEIGNIFVRRPGSDDNAAPVTSGSHMDSQPTGGRYDGMYGVLAAFEALEALDDAGIKTRRPIEAVAWTNEEGSRFQPGTMGSAVFVGAKTMVDVIETRDSAGTRLGDALATTLAATPQAKRRPLGTPMASYVEVHIEQGPRLEIAGKPIGIVTGIQGSRWFQIDVTGDEAHAGTTPLGLRKDALRAALRMVDALQKLMHDETDTVRFTVGRFEVSPGSPNTVPGHVLFTIDFRHPEDSVIARLGDQVEAICRAQAGPCGVTVRETVRNPSTWFDRKVIDLVTKAASDLKLPAMEIFSGAGHDARYMAPICPSGMIFVPCEKGVSHNEAENATPEDLAAGARVLTKVLTELADA
ncbi:MAG: M20 family metallo-hydrolase [Rhodospirillales bacterium]